MYSQKNSQVSLLNIWKTAAVCTWKYQINGERILIGDEIYLDAALFYQKPAQITPENILGTKI